MNRGGYQGGPKPTGNPPKPPGFTRHNRITVDEHMLLCAVRYAIGRQTYIVQWTVSEVVTAWPHLTRGMRELIIGDVIEAAPRFSDIDRPEWNRILELKATA